MQSSYEASPEHVMRTWKTYTTSTSNAWPGQGTGFCTNKQAALEDPASKCEALCLTRI